MTTMSSQLAPPMNHVFVDFENVHQVDLSLIGAKGVSFTLMVGPQQGKLDSDLVMRLMEHSASVRMVKLKKKGSNAVDFALVYYLGQVAITDPTAYFHIISKDAGYDPLIDHLRERHMNVRRHVSCEELTFSMPGRKDAGEKAVVKEPEVKAPVKKSLARKVAAKKVAAKKVAANEANAKKAAKKVAVKAAVKKDSEEGRVARVMKDFTNHPEGRPKKRASLVAKIANLIGKPSDGPEVPRVIDRLKGDGVLIFDEKDAVTYRL
jgi:hypothetical protein